MDRDSIAKLMVAAVAAAALFATGFFFGRTGTTGVFAVETQYAVGAVQPEELAAAKAGGPESQAPEAAQESAEAGALVNINTADAGELAALPGIGETLAGRIIAHREENGPFRIIEEITDVEGIGEKKFVEIQPLITVG